MKYILSLLIAIQICSCSNNKGLFKATDYVKDGVFTSGIEGPVSDFKGNLYAVNYGSQGTIGVVNGENQTKLLVVLPNGSVGNGIRINRDGHLFVADYKNHNILRVNAETKEIRVYAHCDSVNQPNDLAMTNGGVIYASDPNWSDSTGQLWRIDANRKFELLESRMGTTNGIEVSFTDKLLYVNESVQKNVWVYDIDRNFDIANKRLLIKFTNFGLDGMRCDRDGNLYIARYGKGSVVKVSPKGVVLNEIFLKGKFPTNVTFGGVDGKTMYVTMQKRGAIESFRVDVAGRDFIEE